MRKLWIARLAAAALFMICTVLYFATMPEQAEIVVGKVVRLQIISVCFAESAGVILMWIAATLLWGRIYCSTACPAAAAMDVMLHIRRRIPALNRPFRYRPQSRLRHHILIIYIICTAAGITAVPLALDPLFMAGNISMLAGGERMAQIWTGYGLSALCGMVCGMAALLLLLPVALLHGREYCNSICPLGTAGGYLARHAAYQISIDGDRCLSCMRCQDNCRGAAINVAGRYVDNSRCVRCLECVAHCPQQAIRLSRKRNRPSTPLFGKVSKRAGI